MEASFLLDEYRARLRALRRRRSLQGGENPYLELMTLLVGAPPGLSAPLDLTERRRELASLFSWAIPNARALEVLAAHAPLVDVRRGMGTGRRCCALAASTFSPTMPRRRALVEERYHRAAREPWTKIGRLSSVAAARRHGERTLVLCWPPYDDDGASYAVLRAYRGDTLIYIGEPDEGATGLGALSARAAAQLDRRAKPSHLPRWPRLRDTLMVYRRNVERRPISSAITASSASASFPPAPSAGATGASRAGPRRFALQVGKHRVEYVQEMPRPCRLRSAARWREAQTESGEELKPGPDAVVFHIFPRQFSITQNIHRRGDPR